METHSFFLNLLVVLLVARIFAEIAYFIGIPSVIGELLAGVVLGPGLLGWIEPGDLLRLMAEIGIIMLLFQVGLETDVRALVRSGRNSTIVAISGFILPFVFGTVAAWFIFKQELLTAMFIGGALTATSIGITARVLANLKRLHNQEGQIVLGAAVIDDVLGVVLLSLLYEFSIGGGINFINLGKVLLFIFLFFMIAPVMAKIISLLIKKADKFSDVPGLIPTTIVSLVLFFALLSHAVGAPELLGGFAAGLALSRRFFLPFGLALKTDSLFAKRIEYGMRPIAHLFTPIFFVYVGLTINLQDINWSSMFIWEFSLFFFALAVAGKFIGAMLLRKSRSITVIVGLAMSPRGEVGLIFAELGRAAGAFDNQIYTAMVMVIALTTLISPLLMKLYIRFWGHY